MKIVITGGAGFIGSQVAARLIEKNCDVLVVDNLVTGARTNVPAKAQFSNLGAEDAALIEVIRNFAPDAIAHIGGQSSGEIGEKKPLDDIDWNVVSTLNLLTIAKTLGVKRFVYASSMGVYGQAKGGAAGLRESDGGEPISIYGVGKLNSENYLKLFAKRGFDCIALRMFNVYGPGQNMDNALQGMVSIFLSSYLQTGRVTVRGSLQRVRDFIFIDDVVNAWERALLETVPQGFTAMNIGSGIGTTVGQLIETMQSCAGHFPVDVADSTPADQTATIADIAAAKSILSWQPKFSLQQGLQLFVDWARLQHKGKKA